MSDQVQAIIAALVRQAITTGGAVLGAHGVMVSGTQTETLVGAVMVLISVAWSWYHKTTVQPKGA